MVGVTARRATATLHGTHLCQLNGSRWVDRRVSFVAVHTTPGLYKLALQSAQPQHSVAQRVSNLRPATNMVNMVNGQRLTPRSDWQ